MSGSMVRTVKKQNSLAEKELEHGREANETLKMGPRCERLQSRAVYALFVDGSKCLETIWITTILRSTSARNTAEYL